MPGGLGPYEIRSELGRGAMARVWRGYDPVLDREVAIKEPLLPTGVDSAVAAEFGARFVREGRVAARLAHANIVAIHAADIYDGRAVLVMELVEGKTLGEFMSGGPPGPSLTLSVLEQLLSAVGYAHANGVVHRDIKPDNIFVTADGRVKLGDFGIASLASDSTLTQAGTVMGTPGYMAPEQVTGEPADARVDIFAIGVLAYEMLTGKNPFGASEGLPATTVMYRIVHQAPPELSDEALAGLPANMRGILEAALAKDPAARFPDAHMFLAALRGEVAPPLVFAAVGPKIPAGAGGAPTSLGRQTSPVMAGQLPRRNRSKSWILYAALAAAGLVVTTALLVSAGSGGAGAVPTTSITYESGGVTDSTLSAPLTTVPTTLAATTTLQAGLKVQVTQFGAELTLPADWQVTKPLMVDYNHMSWFEATGPQGMFLRCISQVGWNKWHPDPESYHEGDKRNFLKKHPDVVDVSLSEGRLGNVQGLRWEYAFSVDGVAWAGIALYYPLVGEVDSQRTPSELAVRFPDDPAMRVKVEEMLSTFRLPPEG